MSIWYKKSTQLFTLGLLPGDNIQTALDYVNQNGGGEVILSNGVYPLTSNVNLYSNVTLRGQNQSGAILDFQHRTYSLNIIGSNAYTTGTISVTNNTFTVTGSGTSWTNAMVGNQILLSGVWYPIVAVGGATSLTIAFPYGDSTLTSATYVIANPMVNVLVANLQLQNSSGSAIKAQYSQQSYIENINFVNCVTGFEFRDSANYTIDNSTGIGMGNLFYFNNAHLWALSNTGSIDNTGEGLTLIGCTKSTVLSGYFINSGGNGISLTNCSSIGFNQTFSKNSGSNGMELISGNSIISITASEFSSNVVNGIKLTASSNNCDIALCNFTSNGAYGWNIANANCNTNHAVYNHFTSNTSGKYSDSGTSTSIIEF